MARKKREVDISVLNSNEYLKETVALQILGRTLASYASVLTNDEKQHYEVLYQMMRAKHFPDKDLPEIISEGKTPKKSVNKYTPVEAIKEFIKQFPEEAQLLIKLREEKTDQSLPTLTYGLRQGFEPDKEYMINLLQQKLELGRGAARSLYEKIIEPEFQRKREESGLVTVTFEE